MGKIPSCIVDELEDIERHRQCVLALTEVALKVEEIATEQPAIYLVAIPNDNAVVAYAHWDDLRKLGPLLRPFELAFGSHGKPLATPEHGWYAWRWDKVQLLVLPTGAVCQWVEVGKREVPIRELRCEGEPVQAEKGA